MTSAVSRDSAVKPAGSTSVKARQQAMWASGDFAVIGTTLQIVGELLCEGVDLRAGERVLDVAAGNGNATLAAARRFAQRHVDRLRAGAARARAAPRRSGGPRRHVRGGRCRGAALSGRELRRGALDVRRDVRARPRAGRQRDDARVPAGRPDRPGLLDADGFPRAALPRRGQVRAADAGRSSRRSCGAPTRTSRTCSAARRRSRRRLGTSRSAIGRRSTWSRCSGPTMGRSTRRSRRSTREARRRSRPT